MVKSYPVVRLDKKTTAQLYVDTLIWATDNIPGNCAADRINEAVKYYSENKDVTNWEYIYKKFLQKRVMEDIQNGRQ